MDCQEHLVRQEFGLCCFAVEAVSPVAVQESEDRHRAGLQRTQ